MIESWDLIFLAVIALLTSMLSAIVGMAGGIILLSCMLLFLDPLVAVPLHGVVQLCSNGSRAWLQRKHVDVGITWRYALLLLPAGGLGLLVAYEIPADVLKGLIGVFVLLATWKRAWLLFGYTPRADGSKARFVALGGVAGFLNVIVGAIGPLIAPFFLGIGLSRQAIVGTKAACQMLGHITKTLLFGVAGFAFATYAPALALLVAMVIIGSWIGTKLLDRFSERAFTIMFKTALTLVAVRLIAVAVVDLVARGGAGAS